MSKFELKATSTECANAQATQKGFVKVTDVTNDWKKAGSPTGKSFDNFIKDFDQTPGLGYMIVVEKGKKNTKKTPFKITTISSSAKNPNAVTGTVVKKDPKTGKSVKVASTKKTWKEVLEVVADKCGSTVKTFDKKDKAGVKAFIAQFYSGDDAYTGNLTVVRKKVVDKGENRAYTVAYTPNSVEGRYILFGTPLQ